MVDIKKPDSFSPMTPAKTSDWNKLGDTLYENDIKLNDELQNFINSAEISSADPRVTETLVDSEGVVYNTLKDKNDTWELRIKQLENNTNVSNGVSVVFLPNKESYDALVESGQDISGVLYITPDIVEIFNIYSKNLVTDPTTMSGANASVSVANNIITITGNGASTSSRGILYAVNNDVLANDKIFQTVRCRLNRQADNIKFIIRANSPTTDKTTITLDNPPVNEWFDLTTIYTMDSDASGLDRFGIYATFPDLATQGESTIEISLDESNEGGLFIFNLSEIDRDEGTTHASSTQEDIYAIRYDGK